MVQIFSLALGLEETALDRFFEVPFTDITINHYPPQPAETVYKQVLYPHADYGGEFSLLSVVAKSDLTLFLTAFTLLAQSKPDQPEKENPQFQG